MAVVTDNFNRADGGLGPNWGMPPASGAAIVIVGNKACAGVQDQHTQAFYSGSSFSDNQYSQYRYHVAGTNYTGLILRADAVLDRYYLAIISSPFAAQMYARWDGSYNLLLDLTTTATNEGDIIRFQVEGTSPITLTLYRNSVVLGSRTFSGALERTGGSPGIAIYSPSGTDRTADLVIDDWQSDTGSTIVNLVGVSASPAISAGTIEIETVAPPETGLVAGGGRWDWPQEETVYLTGVAASPAVGELEPVARGTLDDLAKNYPFPRQRIELTKPYTAPRRVPVKTPEKAPETIVVRLTGVKSVAAVGSGTVKTVFELLDDEILALLEAA